METSITVSPSAEKWGQEYTVFISDWDMERVWGLFSEQEKKSFEELVHGTMAQTMLALTMVVYALEQDRKLTATETYLKTMLENDRKTGDKDSN